MFKYILNVFNLSNMVMKGGKSVGKVYKGDILYN